MSKKFGPYFGLCFDLVSDNAYDFVGKRVYDFVRKQP